MSKSGTQVADYRSLRDQLYAAHTATDDRTEAFNRLHEFYDRHYQDGDFIVQRRYGKDGARYVKSTGDDTEFRWATEDMYYIKSGDIFTDYPVRLSNGKALTFAVDPESLVKTRAELKPTDKAGYQFKAIRSEDGGLRVVLDYIKGAQNKGKLDKIVAEAATKSGATTDEVARQLRRYIARNQSDFFIHKRLREALDEDLDIFLKTEVLDADQLLAAGDGNLAARAVRLARAVREIGRRINAFLGVLEDHQKRLWEKKKLVLETRYVITLDRIEKLAGKAFADCVVPGILQNKAQVDEWQSLGLGTFAMLESVRRTDGSYFPLPIDTRHFDEDFKWVLLANVTTSDGLDEVLDGVAIRSDNWQALNVMREKFQKRIKAVYADPPYNTDAGPINYKNGYRSASWIALMDDRLIHANRLLTDEGVICVTIDDYQVHELAILMDRVYGGSNQLGTSVIRNNPSGRSTVRGFSICHEYAFYYGNSEAANLSRLPRTEKQLERFTQEHGVHVDWRNFRKDGGAVTHRFERPKQFYPIYVTVAEKKIQIPKLSWDQDRREWDVLEQPSQDQVVVWPVDEKRKDRVWSLNHISAKDNLSDLEVRIAKDGAVQIFRRHRPSDGVLPRSWWDKNTYAAREYGSATLANLFGESSAFSFAKSPFAVQDCIWISGLDDDSEEYVLDFFGGSGTTGHAVLDLNSERGGARKFILVETNQYFETVTVPRLKKVGTSNKWKLGRAQEIDGDGVFFRVQSFEQYDDTLENLSVGSGESGNLFAGPEALAYDLDAEARQVLVAADRFTAPFGMTLRRIENAEAISSPVDLVESLVYLLGLRVSRLYREQGSVVITGTINGRNETAAVLWRDNVLHGEEWLQGKMAQHPADRYFTNAPETLSFQGIERFESIEGVFVEKLGGAS